MCPYMNSICHQIYKYGHKNLDDLGQVCLSVCVSIEVVLVVYIVWISLSPKQIEYIEEMRGQFTPPEETQGIWS